MVKSGSPLMCFHLTSKLPKEKNSQENFRNCLLSFCSYPKSLKKGTRVTFLKHFLNAMIINIKVHSIINIIENSKSMELNKCTH